MAYPIKVLIVDDSEISRTMLAKALTTPGKISVIGTANDPYEATEKINRLNPDVITLDVEMPKMNGIEFLKKLIPQERVPTIVVTSSAVDAFEAISAGAVDYIKKPTAAEMASFSHELKQKVIGASTATVGVGRASMGARVASKPVMPQRRIDPAANTKTVIALGASTGGTEALQVVVEKLPANTPGVVIVQHMPAGFTKMYADRLNRLCAMEVREAKDGDRVKAGLILVGAGEFHLRLKRDATGYFVSSKKGDKVSGHCPSVDVLFESVAETAGANAIGAILTGMGADGAKGLLQMRQAGAFTIGQDKETCVVYGMPMMAFKNGAVVKQAPLESITDLILSKLK